MKYQSKDLAQFPEQIRYAAANYTPHNFSINQFDNILLCGLGGSGIAGRISKSLFFSTCPVPIEVISDYVLPAYVGKRTLAIQCSYSGNTEETLAMYAEAKRKGASILSMATGGKLEQLTEADGYRFYKALSGFQPRMALGYSLTYLMLIFAEFMGKDMMGTILAAADALADEAKYKTAGQNFLNALDGKLNHKFIVVCDYYSNPVGLRFCQQLQENAKTEAFLHELPEVNHNVIESYYGDMGSHFLFLNSHVNPRTELRFGFLEELLIKAGNKVHKMDINANELLSVLETIYVLDWASLWIADAREVNSAQITNINALKDFLSKH